MNVLEVLADSDFDCQISFEHKSVGLKVRLDIRSPDAGKVVHAEKYIPYAQLEGCVLSSTIEKLMSELEIARKGTNADG